MTKNELIERLQQIDGNPQVLLNDSEGFILLTDIQLENMHQSNQWLDEYVPDHEFESETGYNTYYHSNYNKEITKCIVFS